MAGIWGAISNKKTIDAEIIGRANNSMRKYCIDKVDTVSGDRYFSSCGHQYFTKEDHNDISPIEDDDIVFTGDCFLYNRDVLIGKIAELSFVCDEKKAALSDEGDSYLCYRLYKSMGNDFVKELRGTFAFSIIEKKSLVVKLFTDHFMNRLLLYSVSGDEVFFASTMDPMRAFRGELNVNRCFILNAFKTGSPSFFTKQEITPYQDIFYVEPASCVCIDLSHGTIKKSTYWNPKRLKKSRRKKKIDEYQREFINSYSNVIENMLRSEKETGIMLSGGLDSASITAFAAPYLKKKGRSLFTYTQVPSADYKSINNSYVMEDETESIRIQEKFYGNLKCNFLSEDDSNCFSNIRDYVLKFDVPNKAFANMPHLTRIYEHAGKDGCKVLLNGGNGNSTISFGIYSEVLSEDLKNFRLLKFYRDVTDTCSEFHISRKKYLKQYLAGIKDSILPVSEDELPFYPEDVKKYKLSRPNRDYQRKYGNGKLRTDRQILEFRHDTARFVQMGWFNTYWSLRYGFLPLDPTQTVEMTEMCLSFPIDCFQQKGICRYVVRGFLKDYIPEKILNPHVGRGRQAADFEFCINRDFDKIGEDFIASLREPKLSEYFLPEYLDKMILEIEENRGNLSRSLLWNAMSFISASIFLNA